MVRPNKMAEISLNFSLEDEPQQFAQEPILTPNPKRFVLFPIAYQDVW